MRCVCSILSAASCDTCCLLFRYNNVSVEDIEHRLRTSFVYNMEERGCTEMRLTIDPRGEFMKKWDVLMIVLILYVCMVTPFEIGFLGPASGLLLVLNRLVDALFAVDMVVNFFLGCVPAAPTLVAATTSPHSASLADTSMSTVSGSLTTRRSPSTTYGAGSPSTWCRWCHSTCLATSWAPTHSAS